MLDLYERPKTCLDDSAPDAHDASLESQVLCGSQVPMVQAYHVIHKRLLYKLLLTSSNPVNLCPPTIVCVCWAHHMHNLFPGFKDVCDNSVHAVLADRICCLQQSGTLVSALHFYCVQKDASATYRLMRLSEMYHPGMHHSGKECTVKARFDGLRGHLRDEEPLVSFKLEADDEGLWGPCSSQHSQHLGHLHIHRAQ